MLFVSEAQLETGEGGGAAVEDAADNAVGGAVDRAVGDAVPDIPDIPYALVAAFGWWWISKPRSRRRGAAAKSSDNPP